MINIILKLLDSFIPATIKDLNHREERDRARALISILLASILILLTLIISHRFADFWQSLFNQTVQIVLFLSVSSIALALVLFKQLGRIVLSANIFAVSVYSALTTIAFNVSEESFMLILSLMMAMPILIAQTASYCAGIIWLLIVTSTPLLIARFGFHPIGKLWLACWTITMAGLFFSIYIGHYYRKNLASRLTKESAQFEFAATHDPLTGLANRATFDRNLTSCLEDSSPLMRKAVLLYLDLDGFKPINDSLGHQSGDRVLVVVGKRLSNLARSTDTVARIGGDEFAVLFRACNLEEIHPLIQRIESGIKKPVSVDGKRISISCSIGVASFPEDAKEPEKLYLIADQRMYEAKERARQSRCNLTEHDPEPEQV